MKQLLIKLAGLFGVVPVRRYESVVKQLGEARSSVHAWKTRADEALAHAKSLEREVRRQSRLLADAKGLVERVRESSEGNRLREQLANTQRQLAAAREQLMAIEVKLDILEGAANVLDARMRTGGRQANRTGAAV